MKIMDLSVIIPVHNEEANIELLYNELKSSLKFLKKYEIIFVDDGSFDKSFEILEGFSKKDKTLMVIKLKSNYGQSIAIRAGLDASDGEKIIIIDGDGQHDPKYIQDFFIKLDSYDVVCNLRKNKTEANKKIKTNNWNNAVRNHYQMQNINMAIA